MSRQYLYNELVGEAGRHLTPLPLAARQGDLDSVKALLDAGADVNRVSAGDQTQPAAHRDRSTATSTSRSSCSTKARTRTLASDNGVDAALRGRSTCQWAPKALYPQPRAYEQQKIDLPRPDDGAARQGRRSERPADQEGLVLGLQLRPRRASTKSGATPFWRAAYATDVDAMKLLVRARRRPQHPDDAAGRAVRASATAQRDVQGRVGPAAGAGRRARRARRCRRRPASATAKASPPTRTATRRAACWPP